MNSNNKLKLIDKKIRRLNHSRKQLCSIFFSNVSGVQVKDELDFADGVIFNYLNMSNIDTSFLKIKLDKNDELFKKYQILFSSVKQKTDTRIFLNKYRENIILIQEHSKNWNTNLSNAEKFVQENSHKLKIAVRIIYIFILLFIFYQILGLFWNIQI